MSDTTWIINFGNVRLEAIFRGNDLRIASVEFMLKNPIGHIIQQLPVIPVQQLLNVSYVIEKSIRIYELQIESELHRMLKEKEKRDGKKVKEDGKANHRS